MASSRKKGGSKAAQDIIFTVEGLTKVYHTGELDIHALSGIDLKLYEGELAVLLGPSGSGKSTLLNILGGLDVASDGHVWFRNREITARGGRCGDERQDAAGRHRARRPVLPRYPYPA